MTVIYEPLKRTLEVDGVEYHNVSVNAYNAMLADQNPEAHFRKYIEPVYCKVEDIERCVMYGGK